MITVVGMSVQELIEMLHYKPHISSYFRKWRKINKAIMIILFLLAGASWVMGTTITRGWRILGYSLNVRKEHGYDFFLCGNSCFSVGIVVSIFHLFDLCQVTLRQFSFFSQTCFINNILLLAVILVNKPKFNSLRYQISGQFCPWSNAAFAISDASRRFKISCIFWRHFFCIRHWNTQCLLVPS